MSAVALRRGRRPQSGLSLESPWGVAQGSESRVVHATAVHGCLCGANDGERGAAPAAEALRVCTGHVPWVPTVAPCVRAGEGTREGRSPQ